MPRPSLALAILCGLIPLPLAAQDTLVRATIDSGVLVRMHPAAGVAIRGRLVRPVDSASTVIYFCRYPSADCSVEPSSPSIQEIGIDSIVRLEVQRGSKWGVGAAIGGVISGFLFTRVYGWSSGAFFVGALPGAIIGGLIGNGSPTWGPAP